MFEGVLQKVVNGRLFLRSHFLAVYFIQVALPILANAKSARFAAEKAICGVPAEKLLNRIFPEELVSIPQEDVWWRTGGAM